MHLGPHLRGKGGLTGSAMVPLETQKNDGLPPSINILPQFDIECLLHSNQQTEHHQHSIGYMGDGCTGQDPTNSIKVLNNSTNNTKIQ